MKRCSLCKIYKPPEEFHKHTATKDGLDTRCKTCKSAKHKEDNYKLTQETYDELKRRQGGKCRICKRRKDLYVDHDHKTGIVRGLLCQTCNTALGHLKDSVENLQAAVAYLLHPPFFDYLQEVYPEDYEQLQNYL